MMSHRSFCHLQKSLLGHVITSTNQLQRNWLERTISFIMCRNCLKVSKWALELFVGAATQSRKRTNLPPTVKLFVSERNAPKTLHALAILKLNPSFFGLSCMDGLYKPFVQD
ncbi:uncharacterized protein [Phaseolus vulgaris]|uniref:uncharacterized protein isoform X2 n=1 Tax=Phaseolus vulgaris TaxID=3885 RepID=UPI0035CBFB68